MLIYFLQMYHAKTTMEKFMIHAEQHVREPAKISTIQIIAVKFPETVQI